MIIPNNVATLRTRLQTPYDKLGKCEKLLNAYEYIIHYSLKKCTKERTK
jgi:hypothetical protein